MNNTTLTHNGLIDKKIELLARIQDLANRAIAEDRELKRNTELKGTYKQVRWAKKLQKRFLNSNDTSIEMKRLARVEPIAQHAEFWIDLRKCSNNEISQVLAKKVPLEVMVAKSDSRQ